MYRAVTSDLLYRDDISFKAVFKNEKPPAKPGKRLRVKREQTTIIKRIKRTLSANSKLSKDTNRDFFMTFQIDSPLLYTERGETHKRINRKKISTQK